MNPNQCRVALRPRDPLEVLDLAFAFARERAWPLARMLALTVLPAWLGCSVLAVATGGHWSALALALALGPVIQAAFTLLTGRLLFAEEVSNRTLLADTLRRLPALVAVWVVRLVALVLSSLLCFTVLPVAHGALLYQNETALLERVGPGRGVRRSRTLAAHAPGSALAGVVAWYVLLAWFALVAEVTGHQVLDFVLQVGRPFGSVLDGRVTPSLLAGVLLFQPAYAVYRLLLYVDVRTRVEGWDLQVALRALGLER